MATTMEEVGSGSGSRPLHPAPITESTDAVLETTSRYTPALTSTSRPPSSPTTSRTSTQVATAPSPTTQPQDTSLKCFCSTCPTNQTSCGPNSRCYVGKDFEPRQDVNGAAIVGPESYSWGCFSESEAVAKCAMTDKYSCCSDQDYCNQHLTPPPLKCFCSLNDCPDGQENVTCGANTTCYVGLPSDSTSSSSSPDSLTWGCFDPSEAKVKCSDTERYNCCSNRDNCNKDLNPPRRKVKEECTSASGVCQTKQQLQTLLPIVIVTTLGVLLIVIVFILVLLIKIRNLRHGMPVNANSSANSDSSENSVTTESESLPSPTSASSPHHHYLHITTDEPAFGDSVKCNGSKA